jgi:hypothetical protein
MINVHVLLTRHKSVLVQHPVCKPRKLRLIKLPKCSITDCKPCPILLGFRTTQTVCQMDLSPTESCNTTAYIKG